MATGALAFSADGRRLASGSDDGLVRLWNVGTGTLLASLEGHFDRVTALAFGAEDKLLASGSADKTVLVRDVSMSDDTLGQAQVLRTVNHDGAVNVLAFAQDGSWLATGADDTLVRIFEPTGETPPRTLRGNTLSVKGLVFLAKNPGWLLASASDDGTLRVWDSANWDAPATVLRGHEGPVNALARLDGAQPRLVSAGEEGNARVWNVLAPFLEPQVQARIRQLLTEVGLDDDGSRMIALGNDETTALVVDLDASSTISLTGHSQRIVATALNPAGDVGFTASVDGTARLWDAKTGANALACRSMQAPCWQQPSRPMARAWPPPKRVA